MKRKKLGQLGEKLAVNLLRKNKYKILERNFHSKFGEVDIIAQDGDVLVFIEVKARRSREYGTPEEALSLWKLERIIKTGQHYHLFHPQLPEKMRVDVVAIEFGAQETKARIIKNVSD